MKSDVSIEDGGKSGFSIQYMPFTRVVDGDDDGDGDGDDEGVLVELLMARAKIINTKVSNCLSLRKFAMTKSI